MALTPAQRKQNQRDREHGREETHETISREEKAHDEALLARLMILDQTEEYFHKSECLPRVELLRLYNAMARNKPILKGKKLKGKKSSKTGKRTFEEWLWLRNLCRTNLFFLAKYLLGFKDLDYKVHKPVCDAFVKKDFQNTYHKDYSLADIRDAFWRMRETRHKNSLILDPRGFFKTSINMSDIVQWLLCCPDVKILLLTAEAKRANDLLVAVKGYFNADEEHLTDFQLLFPEYILHGVAGTSNQPLDCPARKRSLVGVDHSFWVKSQSSQKTGSHADIGKRDDIVTPENSTTPDLRLSVQESADDTANLILEHGFIDTIGTRYTGGKDPDYYGVMLKREADSAEEDKDLRYFVRPCWRVKPEYTDLKLEDLTLEMVALTFPLQARTEKASFRGLRRKLLDNKRSFRNQQLNEPIDSEEDSPWAVHFTEEFLRLHTIPKHLIPTEGRIFQTCDLSYGEKSTSDFSVIVTGLIYLNSQGKYAICVLDVKFGKWKSSELATQICLAYREWPAAEQICIERINGASWLYENIGLVGQKYGVPEIKEKIILWPVDLSPNAKRTRIKNIEFLMADNRFDIVTGVYIDELYKQFTMFTGDKSTASKKDDIPDGCSFMLNYLPKSALKRDVDPEEVQKEAEEIRLKELQKAMYERMFSGASSGWYGRASNWNPQQSPETIAAPVEPKPDPRRAMMTRVFGGNGMRA